MSKAQYRNMVDLLVKYYERIKESTPDLENIWIFLMETIYN